MFPIDGFRLAIFQLDLVSNKSHRTVLFIMLYGHQ